MQKNGSRLPTRVAESRKLLAGSCLTGRWKLNPRPRFAPAGRAPDAAAVRLDDAPRDRQDEAGPAAPLVEQLARAGFGVERRDRLGVADLNLVAGAGLRR